MDLGPDDFGGAALEGCNENLVVTRPDAVQEVHRQFLEAGCDVIETDTFGATSLVLAEYDLQDQTYELNVKAAQLAREMADRYSTAREAALCGRLHGAHHEAANPGACGLRCDARFLCRTGPRLAGRQC